LWAGLTKQFKVHDNGILKQLLTFLDIIHHPLVYVKQHFGDWTLPPSSGKKAYSG
jgi:hypothetical protein